MEKAGPGAIGKYTNRGDVSRELNMKKVAAVVVTAFIVTAHGQAEAVALRPDKATDDSVCDLAPNTNGYLGRKMLVPAVASPKDQIDAYFRMASSFIATHCKDGQALILQGSSDVSVDAPSLTQVANSACIVAGVTRSESATAAGDRTVPGFELRCTIAKHGELVQKLADLERNDPMNALKARMVGAVQQAEQGSRTSNSGTTKKDCNKVTLATLLQGGNCK